MNHPTDELPEQGQTPDWSDLPAPVEPPEADGVEELAPDGGPVGASSPEPVANRLGGTGA